MAAEDDRASHAVEPPGVVAGGCEEAPGDEPGSKPGYRPHGLWDAAGDSARGDAGRDANSDADVMRLLRRARADLDAAISRHDSEMRQRAGQLQKASPHPASPKGRVMLLLPEGPSPTPSQGELSLEGGQQTPLEHQPERDGTSYVFDSVLTSGQEATRSKSPSGRRSKESPFAASSSQKSTKRSWNFRHRSTRSSKSMDAVSSMHVAGDAPLRSMPSIRKGGWVRRLSMDQQSTPMDQALSKFLAPRESRREAQPLTKTQHVLRAIVKRTEYEVLRALLIIMDACLVVFEAERAGHQALSLPAGGRVADGQALLVLLDLSFAAFLVDSVLRFVADQYDLSVRAGSGWRWFNMATVSAHFLQVVAHHAHAGERSISPFRIVFSVLAAMRILRVVSLVQVTTSIRNLNLFRELRILVHSLIGALQSLMWCSCMGFIVLAAFGMLFSEGALAFWMRQERTSDAATTALMEDFGTLLTASLSLYKSMSGGADWGEIYVSLKPLGGGFCALYLIFITFAIIALLNIATAVFVESTMRRSKSDREMMVQSELNDKREFMDSVRKIFSEFDTEGEGITKESLQKHLEDPKIGAYFAKLGVDCDHFEKLYNLLDRDQSGFIDLEEFTFGCVRLRGEAKCLDIEDLRYSINSACKTFQNGLEGLDSFTQGVTGWFELQKQDLDAALDARLGHLDATLEDLCRDVSDLSQTFATATVPERPTLDFAATLASAESLDGREGERLRGGPEAAAASSEGELAAGVLDFAATLTSAESLDGREGERPRGGPEAAAASSEGELAGGVLD